MTIDASFQNLIKNQKVLRDGWANVSPATGTHPEPRLAHPPDGVLRASCRLPSILVVGARVDPVAYQSGGVPFRLFNDL